MNKYKLRTIKDIFDQVPADRIEECMKELTTLICSSKHMAETVRLVMSDTQGKEIPQLYAFPDEIVWKDDGNGLLEANLPLGKQNIKIEIKRGQRENA